MRIFLCVCIFISFLYAYEGTPDEQVSSFFDNLLAGKNTEAIDKLFPPEPVLTKTIQQITLLKQRIGTLSSFYGELIGAENIITEEISPSVIRIVEVAKYEYHPVIWEFYFYRPHDKWIISQATFVDQFQTVGSKK